VPGPLELHIAVTARCTAHCQGCYVDARPEGVQPSFDELCARLEQARALGVSTVAFGGGEPLLRRDLAALARHARALGLVPVMTTSGIGLTEPHVDELRSFAQINVSYDGAADGYALVRGFDGRAPAERAIGMLARAGIAVGVNVVLTRASFALLGPTCARAADLGAQEVQLLRYKPAGRAAGPDYFERRLTPEQVGGLWPAIAALVAARTLRVRIDCAMVPLLSESLGAAFARPADTLERLGVLGCEAGRHLGALRADGLLAPCSFSPATAEGSTAIEAPTAIEPPGASPSSLHDGLSAAEQWEQTSELSRFRAYHLSPPAPCATCPLLGVCRGGCQVVSRHVSGRFAPDPECPRVRAHRASGGVSFRDSEGG
jgi:radical SAM protein with 4Fe4S-binding SPASM domain